MERLIINEAGEVTAIIATAQAELSAFEMETAARLIRDHIERFGADVAGAIGWMETAKAQEMYLAANGSKNIRATAEAGARSNEIAIDAYREAIKHAELFGEAGNWTAIQGRLMVHVANLMCGYMESIYPKAEEAKPEFAPVAPAKTEDKFWKWFDRVEALALETDDGKEFAAAGFKLHHTGGGCTAWRREIPETAWSVIIVTDDAGHLVTPEDIANGGHYVVFVEHNEECSYSASQDEGTAFEAICRANKMQGIVLAGGFRQLGVSWGA